MATLSAVAAPAAAQDAGSDSLPSAFSAAGPSLRDLYLGRLAPETPDARWAAAAALVGIANRAPSCISPSMDLPYVETTTQTTRTMTGITRSETSTSTELSIPVRPVFAEFLASILGIAGTAAFQQGARITVERLVSDYGCDSQQFRQLEREIARAIGVDEAWEARTPPLPAATDVNGIATDWADFTARCVDVYEEEHVMSNPVIHSLCICQEYAVAGLGDRELYEAVKQNTWSVSELPEDQASRAGEAVAAMCGVKDGRFDFPEIVHERSAEWAARRR